MKNWPVCKSFKPIWGGGEHLLLFPKVLPHQKKGIYRYIHVVVEATKCFFLFFLFCFWDKETNHFGTSFSDGKLLEKELWQWCWKENESVVLPLVSENSKNKSMRKWLQRRCYSSATAISLSSFFSI